MNFLHSVLTTSSNYALTILPWYIPGVLLTYLAELYVFKPTYLRRFAGPLTYPKLILSQLLGMLSPLSIMSFLPLFEELAVGGISPALIFSFLLAERTYDIQSFFIISGFFGIRIALVNAYIIFSALVMTVIFIKREKVIIMSHPKNMLNHFWKRQLKLLLIILAGIMAASFLRHLLPQQHIGQIAGSSAGGTLVALILGAVMYFGPIIGNYPVAKALFDVGMSQTGVLAFLSISPVLNIVIISLFSSVVGFKLVGKAIGIYTFSALLLLFLVSPLL